MVFLFFILAVLISSLFYLRLSRRFDSYDLELSEDIRKEIDGLITQFNNSADNNVTLIEDKISEAKTLVSELVGQATYLKDLKETLQKEIKDLQRNLNLLKEDEKLLLNQQLSNKTTLESTYQKLEHKVRKIEVQQSNIQSKIAEENNDLVEFESKTVVEDDQQIPLQMTATLAKPDDYSFQQTLKRHSDSIKKQHENLETAEIPVIMHEEKVKSDKETVIRLAKEGFSIEAIVQETKMTKGEIELILRLFGGDS